MEVEWIEAKNNKQIKQIKLLVCLSMGWLGVVEVRKSSQAPGNESDDFLLFFHVLVDRMRASFSLQQSSQKPKQSYFRRIEKPSHHVDE